MTGQVLKEIWGAIEVTIIIRELYPAEPAEDRQPQPTSTQQGQWVVGGLQLATSLTSAES